MDLDLCVNLEASRWKEIQDSEPRFGLVARKETDALYLEMREFDRRLSVDMVAKRGPVSGVGARAAAISATHLLVQKAALALDVAPDEFEALEPRLRANRPMLQIADSLINGSGLCRRLGERDGRGKPRILELIEDILSKEDLWPLKEFLADLKNPLILRDSKRPEFESLRLAGWRIIWRAERCGRRRSDLISFMNSLSAY